MDALNVQVACPALRLDACGRPNCPRCGSAVHLAERSAFNPNGRIRHSWVCDQCGEEFATSNQRVAAAGLMAGRGMAFGSAGLGEQAPGVQ